MNLTALLALALGVLLFALTHRYLRHQSERIRLTWLGVFVLLSIPFLSFDVYYLHVLPEHAWFYNLRVWRGAEFLVLFLGCALGAAASLLRRMLLGFPLFAFLALGAMPYAKPLVSPLPDSALQDRWRGAACLQSTGSTCGPASVNTILKRFGCEVSERTIARAAYTYTGGTEAWYLARYVRGKGFVPRFDFRETFSPEAGLPAVVGVKMGCGHFIAVLEISDGKVTFADPLFGEQRISLSEFQRAYNFTGFHMVITKP